MKTTKKVLGFSARSGLCTASLYFQLFLVNKASLVMDQFFLGILISSILEIKI